MNFCLSGGIIVTKVGVFMKESTANRLKQLLADRKLKQVDVLEKALPYSQKYGVKLSKSDLSQYISGKVVPGQDKLTLLGLALNVSEAWLMGYDVPMERSSTTAGQDNTIRMPSNIIPVPTATKTIPLLGTIACGVPILADENLDGEVYLPDFIHADFALRCKGDSMVEARILDGDIVYIRKQPDVENGEIAAVLVGDEATLKRVYKYPGQVVLQPANPKYAPLIYTGESINDMHILGKAVYFVSAIR